MRIRKSQNDSDILVVEQSDEEREERVAALDAASSARFALTAGQSQVLAAVRASSRAARA